MTDNIQMPPNVRYGLRMGMGETDRITAAVAAERERCAKILTDYADAHAYDPEEHDDLLQVADRIRSGE